jgi:hypothetical protein
MLGCNKQDKSHRVDPIADNEAPPHPIPTAWRRLHSEPQGDLGFLVRNRRIVKQGLRDVLLRLPGESIPTT